MPLIFLFFTVFSSAQDRKTLEEERMRIIDKIEFTSNILKRTEKNKKATIDYLNSLQNQIRNRNKIIANLNKQINQINENINTMNIEYNNLSEKKSGIEHNFEFLLRKTYVQSLTKNKFLFLLSSTDWEDFMDRKRYLKQFNIYTKTRLQQISEQKQNLDKLLTKINVEKANVEKLIKEENDNVLKLKEESKKKDKILKELKRDRKKLVRVLKKQKKEREKLNKNIENIILNNLSGGNSVIATSEAKVVSNSFEENKSKFSWPVKAGYISSHFGKHRHPTIKGVYNFNNGIDFRTEPDSEVKSIFEGEVVGLMHITGYNWMIIIKHGKYYTVYSKLENVVISKGDKVKRGQTLGRIGDNGQFHFEIWKEKTKLNPEKWILKI